MHMHKYTRVRVKMRLVQMSVKLAEWCQACRMVSSLQNVEVFWYPTSIYFLGEILTELWRGCEFPVQL